MEGSPSACLPVFHDPQLLTLRWCGQGQGVRVARVCILQRQGLHMLAVYCTWGQASLKCGVPEWVAECSLAR